MLKLSLTLVLILVLYIAFPLKVWSDFKAADTESINSSFPSQDEVFQSFSLSDELKPNHFGVVQEPEGERLYFRKDDGIYSKLISNWDESSEEIHLDFRELATAFRDPSLAQFGQSFNAKDVEFYTGNKWRSFYFVFQRHLWLYRPLDRKLPIRLTPNPISSPMLPLVAPDENKVVYSDEGTVLMIPVSDWGIPRPPQKIAKEARYRDGFDPLISNLLAGAADPGYWWSEDSQSLFFLRIDHDGQFSNAIINYTIPPTGNTTYSATLYSDLKTLVTKLPPMELREIPVQIPRFSREDDQKFLREFPNPFPAPRTINSSLLYKFQESEFPVGFESKQRGQALITTRSVGRQIRVENLLFADKLAGESGNQPQRNSRVGPGQESVRNLLCSGSSCFQSAFARDFKVATYDPVRRKIISLKNDSLNKPVIEVWSEGERPYSPRIGELIPLAIYGVDSKNTLYFQASDPKEMDSKDKAESNSSSSRPRSVNEHNKASIDVAVYRVSLEGEGDVALVGSWKEGNVDGLLFSDGKYLVASHSEINKIPSRFLIPTETLRPQKIPISQVALEVKSDKPEFLMIDSPEAGSMPAWFFRASAKTENTTKPKLSAISASNVQTTSSSSSSDKNIPNSQVQPAPRYPTVVFLDGSPGISGTMNRWNPRISLLGRYLADNGVNVLIVDLPSWAVFKSPRSVNVQLNRDHDDLIALLKVVGEGKGDFSSVDLSQITVWAREYSANVVLQAISQWQGTIFPYARGVVLDRPIFEWAVTGKAWASRYPLEAQNSLGLADLSKIYEMTIIHGMLDTEIHVEQSLRLMRRIQETTSPSNSKFRLDSLISPNHSLVTRTPQAARFYINQILRRIHPNN